MSTPLSVFMENSPSLAISLEVLGTIAGVGGIYLIVKGFNDQNKERDANRQA